MPVRFGGKGPGFGGVGFGAVGFGAAAKSVAVNAVSDFGEIFLLGSGFSEYEKLST